MCSPTAAQVASLSPKAGTFRRCSIYSIIGSFCRGGIFTHVFNTRLFLSKAPGPPTPTPAISLPSFFH